MAVWGEVLSTVAFCWQILLWRRSHPQLNVKAEVREGSSSDQVRFKILKRGGQSTRVEEMTRTIVTYPGKGPLLLLQMANHDRGRLCLTIP